ncbi:T9SS type A sorting domain-containing protein [Polaribacter sp. Z014]|uniref:T9SS type A sorting domain-containing protein n=1 Tax=Polaribacter sp. Z014 TaxID=2927126 RepID=UPI0020222AA8|nr:T9SS type A sorting domain-containing protein [Polaribacter sp. Z014]MCL7764512.1 T9SS type A sorting domain-containing protein [Polaribacter sp. Z014]
MKKITFLIIFILLSNLQQGWAETKIVNWDAGITDYSTQLQSLINSSDLGDIIKFESGKIYPFKKLINVNQGIVFTSTDVEKAILRMMESSTDFFKLVNALPNNNRVTFTNLELDGNQNITKAVTGKYDACLIRSYGKKVSVIDCVLRDGENGIRGQVGYALHGLKLENTDFYEIINICVLILNRQTRINRIEELTEKIDVIGNRFHPGYQRGIISDCGNDFYDVEFPGVSDAQKRYTYTTDLKGTYIYDNDFEGWNKWCIGFVQSKNALIHGNRMTNQATTAQSYNASIHLEQFVSDITISENIFTNNITGASTFIDFAGGEAKRRYQNTPEIITRDLDDGTIGTCQPGDMNSNAQANLDCRPKPHSYGQRRIYIYGNTFNANENVSLDYVLAMHEVEDFYVGRSQDETIHHNVWNVANKPDEGLIKITKFDEGVCNVKIDEPIEVTIGYKIVYTTATKLEVSMNGSEDCILINREDSLNVLSNSLKDTFSFYPNPSKELITIETPNLGAYKLEVYNAVGQLKKQISVQQGNGKYILSLKEFKNGIYLLKFINDAGVEVKKMMLK